MKTPEDRAADQQEFTPNTGAANWSKDFRTPEPGKNYLEYGVFNMGPCPLPGGKVIFASNRNAFKPPKRLPHTLQLFVMDDDGSNVECIGHLNLGMALHPVILKDGRVMFSSLESQGLRAQHALGPLDHPPRRHRTGGRWSARSCPAASPSAFHFQTQLSDGSIVAEEYYNQTQQRLRQLRQVPATAPAGEAAFGPGYTRDPRNPPLRHGRLDDGQPRVRRLPFSPFGIESLTPFARTDEGPADYAVRGQPPRRGQRHRPRVGKVTHPSGRAGQPPARASGRPGRSTAATRCISPAVDSGIYLIKDGKPIDEPGQMLLIKNDPKYNEQWPRALVPYKRIYGIDEPKQLAAAGQRRQALAAPARGDAVRPGRHLEPVQARELPQRRGEARQRDRDLRRRQRPTGYQDLDPFNTTATARR